MHFLAATVMDLLGKQKYIIANFHVQNFSDLEKKTNPSKKQQN